jgi:hypothetical protein
VETRQVKPGARPEIEDDPILPRGDGPHGLLQPLLGVGREVLDLVDISRVLNVGSRMDTR